MNLNEKEADSWVDSPRELLPPMLFDSVEVKTYVRKSDINDRYRCVQCTDENKDALYRWIIYNGGEVDITINNKKAVLYLHTPSSRVSIDPTDYVTLDSDGIFRICLSYVFEDSFEEMVKEPFDSCFTKTKRISYAIFNKETKNDIIEYLGSHNYYSDISTDDNGDPYLVFCEKHRSPIIGTPAAIGDYIVQNKDDSFISYTPEEFHNLYII